MVARRATRRTSSWSKVSMQNKSRLKWFAIPIYMRSSEPVGGDRLLEEAIHLFRAASEAQAVKKAERLAKSLEQKYPNVYGKQVAWSLDEIGEPWELTGKLQDGAEVFPRFMTETARNALRSVPEGSDERQARPAGSPSGR